MNIRIHFPLIALLIGITSAQDRAIIVEDEQKRPILETTFQSTTSAGVQLHLVRFDSRKCKLVVADQANGPSSRWEDAKVAGNENHGLAAINAGFFTPQGQPLGLLVSQGIRRGSNNPSFLGTGIYFLPKKSSHAGIVRRAQLPAILQGKPSDLLQSGPMLVDRSSTVKGLSETDARPRSFIATDGSFYWLIGYAESCTLAELGKALSNAKLAGITIRTALNLDGGRSSDLWISPKIVPSGKHIRGFFNKPVRNFLILKSAVEP